MIVEKKLTKLCEELINILYDLNKQSLITDKELQSHLVKKLEFLEEVAQEV